MNVYTGPVLVGAGFVLCVISSALTLWAVADARKDVRAARRLGRLMIAASAVAFPVLLWVALPDYFVVTFGFPPPRIIDAVPNDFLVLILACVAYFAGLTWMTRIYRTSHLEPERPMWRYREV